MTKKNYMPIIVLTIICIAVAALLAGVNELTKDTIAENELRKEQASLLEVLPGSSLFEEIDTEGAGLSETVKSVYVETSGKGYVVIVSTTSKYSTAPMTISVGISNDFVISGLKITSYNETKDFGKTTYPEKFIGKTSDDYDSVEIVTGVTYSSEAFKDALGDALSAAKKFADGSTQTVSAALPSYAQAAEENSDTSLSSRVSTLVGGKSFSETALPEGAAESLKKLYSVEGGEYVAYILVPGEYVPVATEGLVYIGSNCVIKKVDLFTWVVGHGVGAGNFSDGFTEKTNWNINDVELVSGATGTSRDFFNEAKKALKTVTALIGNDEANFIAAVNAMIPESMTATEMPLPNEAPTTLKRLFKVGDAGCVAYVVVPGEYVSVATSALIYVDGKGNIAKINLIDWTVGHGVGPGNFADEFTGKNTWYMHDVELVSGATGTSRDFFNAANATLNLITEMLGVRESNFYDMITSMIPGSNGVENMPIPDGAPKTLVALYRDKDGRGTVAHIVVPGEYVPVATEAYVAYDKWGKILDIDLVQWVVGHGVGAGDFAEGFIGSTRSDINKVELVSGATGTSLDFRNAVAAAYPYIPAAFPIYRAIGIAVLSIAVVGFITAITISRKRRMAK